MRVPKNVNFSRVLKYIKLLSQFKISQFKLIYLFLKYYLTERWV